MRIPLSYLPPDTTMRITILHLPGDLITKTTMRMPTLPTDPVTKTMMRIPITYLPGDLVTKDTAKNAFEGTAITTELRMTLLMEGRASELEVDGRGGVVILVVVSLNIPKHDHPLL